MDIKSNNQILSFKLKEQSYAVFIANVKEIIKAPTDISNYVGNKELKGIIGYRSGTLPIVDLSTKLNQADNLPILEEQFIIVVEKDEQVCGFLVDRVEDIQETNESTLDDVPVIGQTSENQFVKTIFKRGDSIVPILDLEKMI